MKTIKSKVITDYNELRKGLKEQLKLQYPYGFAENLINFINEEGQTVSALRFETEEEIYLLRMTPQMALQLIEEDDDYDDNYQLKYSVKKEYEEKHGEIELFDENEDIETC